MKGFSTKFMDTEEGEKIYSQLSSSFTRYQFPNARLPKQSFRIDYKILLFLRNVLHFLKV